MNVMNWESKRNDFLIWMRLYYINGTVYMLSWDRVSSLWFWLSNCLVFKVLYLLQLQSVAIVLLYLLALRNTLWAWTYHHKMCCVVCLDSREYQELNIIKCVRFLTGW